MRVGVIHNPKARRNRDGRARLDAPPEALVAEVGAFDFLPKVLADFAEAGVELLVVDGGDGTVRDVLSRLPEAFGGRLPRLAILPSGKTNVLAKDLGARPGWTLRHALAAASGGNGHIRTRTPMEVRWAGATSPPMRGFMFGAGAYVRATALAQDAHRRGLFDSVAVAVALAGAVVRTVAGRAGDPWRAGDRASLAIDDAPARDADRLLVLASALENLPLGLRPFGPPRAGVKLLEVDAPPIRLAAAAPGLAAGFNSAWLADHGYRRADVRRFTLKSEGDFVLDGEIYPGGDISVGTGPVFEFVTP